MDKDFLSEDSKYAHLTPLELLRKETKTERIEQVPVNKIVLEGSITDEDHIKRLGESMQGPRGQISPLTVRAREIGEDFLHYDIIDGFHRAPALINIDKEFAKCVVMYGCSDEEMFDLRILAASSVKSVQYARVAQWMQLSFKETEWYKRGLTLTQVFSLATFDDPGTSLGLTLEESDEIKLWAEEKAKMWQRGIASIYQTSRVLKAADPDLVKSVRSSVGRRGLKPNLSPAQLKAIVFPLQSEHDLQKRIAEVVLERNLTGKATTALANAIARVKDNPNKIASILEDPYIALGLDYGFRQKDKSSTESSRLTISKRTLERRLNQLVSDHNLTPDEKKRLKKIAESTRKSGNAEKLGIILDDPRFFIGESREDLTKKTKVSDGIEDDTEISPEELSRQLMQEAKSYSIRSRKKAIIELEQSLDNYQGIIRRQEHTIKSLEEGLFFQYPLDEENPARITLMKRHWGLVELNTITGRVGSKKIGEVELSANEKNLLLALVRYKNIPLDYKTIVTLTREDKFIQDDLKVIWVTLSRMRQKLNIISPLLSERIKRIKEYGYMWE